MSSAQHLDVPTQIWLVNPQVGCGMTYHQRTSCGIGRVLCMLSLGLRLRRRDGSGSGCAFCTPPVWQSEPYCLRDACCHRRHQGKTTMMAVLQGGNERSVNLTHGSLSLTLVSCASSEDHHPLEVDRRFLHWVHFVTLLGNQAGRFAAPECLS